MEVIGGPHGHLTRRLNDPGTVGNRAGTKRQPATNLTPMRLSFKDLKLTGAIFAVILSTCSQPSFYYKPYHPTLLAKCLKKTTSKLGYIAVVAHPHCG